MQITFSYGWRVRFDALTLIPLPQGEGIGPQFLAQGGGRLENPLRVREGWVTGLAAAIVLLCGIHFVQIAAGFPRRVTGGQRLVNIARCHAVNDVRGLHFVA